jgi:hypothetical protein
MNALNNNNNTSHLGLPSMISPWTSDLIKQDP